MNKRQNTVRKPLLSPSEYALIETLAFGRTVLETAFLVGSGVSKAFVHSYSEQIRGASTHQELAEILSRATRRAPLATGTSLGGFSDRVEAQKLERIRTKELDLAAEAKSRASKGLPSHFNRWTDSWCDAASWRPVPFVDGHAGPVYHATV